MPIDATAFGSPREPVGCTVYEMERCSWWVAARFLAKRRRLTLEKFSARPYLPAMVRSDPPYEPGPLRRELRHDAAGATALSLPTSFGAQDTLVYGASTERASSVKLLYCNTL